MSMRLGGVVSEREVVGVVPAAGRATRISPLPCSKEIYPVALRLVAEIDGVRPKAACTYLLERMRFANVTKAYIVLRDGKWDIPAYLQGGGRFDMQLAYLIAGGSLGPPYTVSRAVPFAREAMIAFGFPDMIFRSQDIFVRLIERQRLRSADVVLGLFPAQEGREVDMVDLHEDGRIRALIVQPPDARLRRTWGVALWTPGFSAFLETYVRDHAETAATRAEATMGAVIQCAIEAGLSVEGVTVCDTPYLDIGTPEGLLAAHAGAVAREELETNERKG